MYKPEHVKTSPDFPVPETMRAWVLGDPDQLTLIKKPVPVPKRAEVLVRIDAVAICATDLEIIPHGPPAMIQGGQPFNKNFTPGHEYMGTVVALGHGVGPLAGGENAAGVAQARPVGGADRVDHRCGHLCSGRAVEVGVPVGQGGVGGTNGRHIERHDCGTSQGSLPRSPACRMANGADRSRANPAGHWSPGGNAPAG